MRMLVSTARCEPDPEGQNLSAKSAIFCFLVLIFLEWPTFNLAQASSSLSDREEISETVQSQPRIELELNFESRSTKISIRSGTFYALEHLGGALSNPELRNETFIVAGHSAFEGRQAYDSELSERRAEVVKRFLVENFDIPSEQLITVGYGTERLKNPGDGLAPENQRVEIVNLGRAGRN